ncbi:uncharacterized protein LOC143279399 [Babylonia areolata]|uniref:uncharacterized protein LOC143279399 n=1 Tax=Babylonia areolata TaxID=304850 RepID=UPI003FD4AB4B
MPTDTQSVQVWSGTTHRNTADRSERFVSHSFQSASFLREFRLCGIVNAATATTITTAVKEPREERDVQEDPLLNQHQAVMPKAPATTTQFSLLPIHSPLFLLFPCWAAFLIVPLLLPATSSAAASGGTRHFKFHRKSFMDDKVVKTDAGPMENTLVRQKSPVRTPTECALACVDLETCSSFFHDQRGQQCLMHSIVFPGPEEASALPGTTYWVISQADCPTTEGYVLYRPLALCYKYYSVPSFWDQAESTCNSTGTSLVKVNDQAVSTHLYQFLRGSNVTRSQHVCIGASVQTGSFLWRDGSDVTYFNWASGEPSGGSEQCVTMAWFYWFKWNDVPCSSNSYNFLCQKTL